MFFFIINNFPSLLYLLSLSVNPHLPSGTVGFLSLLSVIANLDINKLEKFKSETPKVYSNSCNILKEIKYNANIIMQLMKLILK